jgi:hypothetical protein
MPKALAIRLIGRVDAARGLCADALLDLGHGHAWAVWQAAQDGVENCTAADRPLAPFLGSTDRPAWTAGPLAGVPAHQG